MNYSINPEFKYSEEDLLDILCSCFEGGCGYWCCIHNDTAEWKEVKQQLGKCATIEDIMLHMMENNIELILIDEEDNDKEHYLTLNKFLNGIKRTIETGIWNGMDIEDVDAVVGDGIIQYALFEELVYG